MIWIEYASSFFLAPRIRWPSFVTSVTGCVPGAMTAPASRRSCVSSARRSADADARQIGAEATSATVDAVTGETQRSEQPLAVRGVGDDGIAGRGAERVQIRDDRPELGLRRVACRHLRTRNAAANRLQHLRIGRAIAEDNRQIRAVHAFGVDAVAIGAARLKQALPNGNCPDGWGAAVRATSRSATSNHGNLRCICARIIR